MFNAQDGMTLEQLMAFTVTSDHERQERVWASLAQSWNNEPHHIRRQLTEGAVRASDKREQFVGVAAYEAAGGIVTRDEVLQGSPSPTASRLAVRRAASCSLSCVEARVSH
jgi:hypothetical protein